MLAAAGCQKSDHAPPPPDTSASGEAGPTLPPGAPWEVGVCTTCHSFVAGKNGLGPSLWGVVGRRAGLLPDYPYSAALRQSGIVWTPRKLDRWLSGPMVMVPGTRMSFGGYADASQRKAVIDYLKTLK